MKLSPEQIGDLCEKVKQLTNNNQHTEARIEIAVAFGLPLVVKRYQLIDQYHGIEGMLTYELGALRDMLDGELFDGIKNNNGVLIAKTIFKHL